MSKTPVRPRRRKRSLAVKQERSGNLFQPDISTLTADDNLVKAKSSTGVVRTENIELQKFAQLIQQTTNN